MTRTVSMQSVTEFCRAKAPAGIGRWPADRICRFLTAREDRQELAISSDAEGRINGLAAVTSSRTRIHIWAVIGPGLLPAFLGRLFARFPDWQHRTITAHRRGRLVRIPPAMLERLTQ